MSKIFLILILIGIIVLGGIIFVFYKNKNIPAQESGVVLFYGTNCPHCQRVEEFIKENKIEDDQLNTNDNPSSRENLSLRGRQKNRSYGKIGRYSQKNY